MEEDADWDRLDKMGYKVVAQKYGSGEFNHPQVHESARLWLEHADRKEDRKIKWCQIFLGFLVGAIAAIGAIFAKIIIIK